MGGGSPKEQTTTTKSRQQGSEQTNQFGETYGTTSQEMGVTLPDYLRDLVTGVPGLTATSLQNLTQGVNEFDVPIESLDAIRRTAAGEYLYGGGPAQQAFIDASMRAAQPGIFSAFGAAGRGTGGLAQAALGTAGIDAYARLYDQERQRQLQAATALPALEQIPLELQSQLLSQTTSIPNQFASLFGRTATGASAGRTYQDARREFESKGTQTTSQPLYETPWWQTALGAGLAIASIPLTGGASAAAAPTVGGAALSGLLGAFR